MRSNKEGKRKSLIGTGNYGLGVVDAFLIKTRKTRATSPDFHLPRDHLRGSSGLYLTKLAIKSLKVLCKIVSFYMTGTYTHLHVQVWEGGGSNNSVF